MKIYMIFILFFFMANFVLSETIFFDDFENSSDWFLTGEFEIGIPNGLGGEHGNADPIQAYEGSKVLGVDLSGYGEYPGDYEPNLSEDEYVAYSPVIDCSNFVETTLSFKRWLGIEQPQYDHARIKISNDNGSSWFTIWENPQTISDDNWQDIQIDISSFADMHSQVKIAFTIGTSDGSWQYCGWNIDNLTVSGSPILYGNIQGHIFDTTSSLPIQNAMVSTKYSHTFTDESGFYILSNVPCLPDSITVYALGFQTLVSDTITPTPDSTTIFDAYLTPLENLPPSPQNLTATVQYNSVNLFWEPPEDSDYYFIAYNIYRNNILIASTTDTTFYDTDLVLGEYFYYVTALFDVGSSMPSNTVTITITSTSANENQITPVKPKLTNYPNPFNPQTTIEFNIENSKNAYLKIFNIKGEIIKEFNLKNKPRKIVWDAKDKYGKSVASGIYYCILYIDNNSVATKKMVLLK